MPYKAEMCVIFARNLVIRRGIGGSLRNGRRKTLTRNLGETLAVLIPDPQFCVTIVGKRGIFQGNAEGKGKIREGEEMAVLEADRWQIWQKFWQLCRKF